MRQDNPPGRPDKSRPNWRGGGRTPKDSTLRAMRQLRRRAVRTDLTFRPPPGVSREAAGGPPIDVSGDWPLKPTRVASRYDSTCALGTGSEPVRAQKLIRAPIAPELEHQKKKK